MATTSIPPLSVLRVKPAISKSCICSSSSKSPLCNNLKLEACPKKTPFLAIERRQALIGASTALVALLSSQQLQSRALGDPTVTIEEVTRDVAPVGALPPNEEAVVKLFEKSTYSVVNIFDATLRPQLNTTGSVEVPEGNGSGIVWDQDGHIVTNYHVIGNALKQNPPVGAVVARVAVLGVDGYQRNFDGIFVGADRNKDMAVLKIDAPSSLLRDTPLGVSERVRVGQRVFAIGNPFGFEHTLTTGIVSGLNRDITSQSGVVISGGVQTDAAINPGNSGGPLLDSSGRLIGINTAIFTRTGTSAGVGFAIPISTVIKIVPQLILFGKVTRPGIKVQLAPAFVAKQLNVREGALVLSVVGNSAASKAGILATRRGFTGNIVLGDIIVAIDGAPVKTSEDVGKLLDDYGVGDKVKLTLYRGEEKLDVNLELEEASS